MMNVVRCAGFVPGLIFASLAGCRRWSLGAVLWMALHPAFCEEFLVTGAAVKLRENPEYDARVIETLRFGSLVTSDKWDKAEEWTRVSGESHRGWMTGWMVTRYLSPHQSSARGSHYVKIAREQFEASRNNFGNLVELLQFINEVLFAIPEPQHAKEMESLRVAVLSRSIELARQSGNNEWVSRYASETGALPSPGASRTPLSQSTTGSMSPNVSNVVGNVTIIYGEDEGQKLRITYWRLKGVAADFLANGLLSREWETILGGQQDIVNNSVLRSGRQLLGLFAAEPEGDRLYSTESRVTGTLEDQEKIRARQRTGKDLKVSLGGRANFSMLFPDKDAARIIATQDDWPPGYSIFHVCHRGGLGEALPPHPIAWKFVSREELTAYGARFADYVNYIARSDSNMSDASTSADENYSKQIIDVLRFVTRNRLPDDFLLVYAAQGAHGGWELQLVPREIEIEIAVIENTSSKAVTVGKLDYHEQEFLALTAYDDATRELASTPKRQTTPLVSGVLKPGEKFVVPTRVSFAAPSLPKRCDSPSYEGDKVFFDSGFTDKPKYKKSRENLTQNVYPKMTPRYTFGAAWRLSALEVDRAMKDVRQANFNGFNFYLSNEKGSCPFIYSRQDARSLWFSEGHVLLGATARNLSRQETKILERAPWMLKFTEHEDEIAYIRQAYVEEMLPSGATIRHDPDTGQQPFVLTRGREHILHFGKLSHIAGASYTLNVEGYYVPLASLNFSGDFLRSGSPFGSPP